MAFPIYKGFRERTLQERSPYEGDRPNYSERVSRFKVLFTRSLRGKGALSVDVSASRRKHRESDVWQRRFWEHTITDEHDFNRHLDYLHAYSS